MIRTAIKTVATRNAADINAQNAGIHDAQNGSISTALMPITAGIEKSQSAHAEPAGKVTLKIS